MRNFKHAELHMIPTLLGLRFCSTQFLHIFESQALKHTHLASVWLQLASMANVNRNMGEIQKLQLASVDF